MAEEPGQQPAENRIEFTFIRIRIPACIRLYLDALFGLVSNRIMLRKPTPLPRVPALVRRTAVAAGIVSLGLGCGTSAPQNPPPQAYVDSGKDAPAPQPFDAGVADAAADAADATADAVADQIAPQPPPQPPQPPQPPPQPPQMPPP